MRKQKAPASPPTGESIGPAATCRLQAFSVRTTDRAPTFTIHDTCADVADAALVQRAENTPQAARLGPIPEALAALPGSQHVDVPGDVREGGMA